MFQLARRGSIFRQGHKSLRALSYVWRARAGASARRTTLVEPYMTDALDQGGTEEVGRGEEVATADVMNDHARSTDSDK